MKKTLAILLSMMSLIALTSCYTKSKSSNTGWINAQGQPSFGNNANVSKSHKDSLSPSIAVDSSDYPCIAWVDEFDGESELLFIRWNGTQWVNAEGETYKVDNAIVTKGSGSSLYPSMKLDSLGHPNIAWQYSYSNDSDSDIYFVKWNGSQWINVEGERYNESGANVSYSEKESYSPSLALDQSDNPCIAWVEEKEDNDFSETFFVRWDGSDWVNVKGINYDSSENANLSNSEDYSKSPSLVIDQSNNPCITWAESVHYDLSSSRIYYVRWDGNFWINYAGKKYNGQNASINNNNGSSPSLVLDSSGNPCIAWTRRPTGNVDFSKTINNEIYYSKWDGSDWVNAKGEKCNGDNANVSWTDGSSRTPSLALDKTGNPFIAWDDDFYVYFIKWDGSRWVDAKGESYQEVSYYMKNKGFYDLLQNACVSDASISMVRSKSFALDSFGNPYVAWSHYVSNDGVSGNSEIFFLKCNK